MKMMILGNVNIDLKPRLLQISSGEIYVTPVPLYRDVSSSPWCYAANVSPPINVDDAFDSTPSTPASCSGPLLPPGTNFLATQVWPSSRIASQVIEKHLDPSWTVCELGCGPGLPSLTAAKSGARKVIATDIDAVALELVKSAAIMQGMIKSGNAEEDGANNSSFLLHEEDHEQRFSTRIFDLTSKDNPLPQADLYILSDVFESSSVAEGAAFHVQTILSKNRKKIGTAVENFGHHEQTIQAQSRVWVFAQSDRAQRDLFYLKMKERYTNNDDNTKLQHLEWTMNHAPDLNSELWLFDLDETVVKYN